MTKSGLNDLVRRKTEECQTLHRALADVSEAFGKSAQAGDRVEAEMQGEIDELERMNDILKGQVGLLLKLNAESSQPSAGVGRRGRARHENMGTISEESPP